MKQQRGAYELEKMQLCHTGLPLFSSLFATVENPEPLMEECILLRIAPTIKNL